MHAERNGVLYKLIVTLTQDVEFHTPVGRIKVMAGAIVEFYREEKAILLVERGRAVRMDEENGELHENKQ